MKIFFVNDFFVSNIFFPFLIICLCLGLLSFFLIFVQYIVCRVEEIRKKEKSINSHFVDLKMLYKKQLIVLDEILSVLRKQDDLLGTNDINLIKKINNENFNNLKKIDNIKIELNTKLNIKSITELENSINYSYQMALSIFSKYPEIKNNMNYVKTLGEYKRLEDAVESKKTLYNRGSKEFNSFIGSFPYILFALIFKIESKNVF